MAISTQGIGNSNVGDTIKINLQYGKGFRNTITMDINSNTTVQNVKEFAENALNTPVKCILYARALKDDEHVVCLLPVELNRDYQRNFKILT